LFRHLKDKHLKISYLECRLCERPERFKNGAALESHLRDSHRGDLLEEDIQATVDASARWDIDWPELCPVCQLSLVQYRPNFSRLEEHLRQKHRGDVLDEDVEEIIGDRGQLSELCPKCNSTVSQTLPLSSLDHLSQCLHDFSLRAIPWNDHTSAHPPGPHVGEVFIQIKQWMFGLPGTFTEPDQRENPPSLDETDRDSLDQLHELFPEIQLSDCPAKKPDTIWRQDSALLNNSEATSSPGLPRLEDDNYFREEEDSSGCPVSDGLLEAFVLFLQHTKTSIESLDHAATSTLLDELETLRTSPVPDAQSLRTACSRLGRLDGPFRTFDQTLLLDENAQLQFQRLNRLTLIAQEGDLRYETVCR
jgi:hypothetical protein